MRIAFAFLFIASLMPASRAINCYKCPDDNFSGVTCTDESSYIGDAEQCSGQSMWCKKTQTGSTVTRSCALSSESPSNGCSDSGDTETCYCNTDFCNGADGRRAAIPTVAAWIIAVAVAKMF